MALIDKASLLMVPSTYEAGTLYNVLPSGNRAPDSTDQNSGYDQTRADFDFDRGSNAAATRVGPTGLIEKGRENLLTYSNDFEEADWLQVNTTLTSGQSGYDGSSNAWKIEAASTGTIRLRQLKNISANSVITMSVYAKIGNVDFIKFNLLTSGTNSIVTFDLTDGTTYASNAIDEKWESVGNGWVRISATFTNSLQITEQRIEVRSEWDLLSATAGSFVYIQDAQLEIGLAATDYIESGATTAKAGVLVDLPRINYDANGENGALLLEPSRQNLVPISEGVPEDTNNVTLTENYGISPEGFQNSLKGQKNGVDANDRIQPIDNYNATLVSGNDYTISCFVKNIDSINGVTTLACRVSGGSLFRSGFDWDGSSLSYLTTGYNAGTRENIFVEDYGNGWWRIGFTFEADGTSGNFELDIDRRNGSNTTSIETWGWQLEPGSYVSSYIPTMGTSETRAADVCNNGGSAESINSTEGVLYAEISALADDGTYRIFSINDGTRNERVYVQYTNASNTIAVVVKNGNVTQANISHSLTDETQNTKVAFRYKANDFAFYINGSQIGTDTSGSTPVGLNNFSFDQGNGANYFYGNVKQVAVFNEALTNAELATLTTL